MTEKKVYRAIGLMSGTSLDGIDCALIETDGHDYVRPLGFITEPYEEVLRGRLRACLGKREAPADVVRDMTLAHVSIVQRIREKADVIGFHGQTIFHAPQQGVTVQIGDGALLARETGTDVVCDFRSADVAAGGQGAPLVPVYHQALVTAAGLDLPVAVLNIGGVANVTYIDENELIAFDTGPGNALIDDFVLARTGEKFDEGGALARSGRADESIVRDGLSVEYFKRAVPKSLDRDAWADVLASVQDLSTEDGAATLTELTVRSVERARDYFPDAVKSWYVTGGGRHNAFIMSRLRDVFGDCVFSVDDAGWNGDAMEAEGFAYLAVRSLLGLPISFPGTTGVREPMTGGFLHRS